MINFLKNSFPCDSLNTDSYLQLLLNDILTSCYNVTCIMIPHILYRDNLWTPASCWLETRPHYIVTLMTSDQYRCVAPVHIPWSWHWTVSHMTRYDRMTVPHLTFQGQPGPMADGHYLLAGDLVSCIRGQRSNDNLHLN